MIGCSRKTNLIWLSSIEERSSVLDFLALLRALVLNGMLRRIRLTLREA